MMDQSAARTDFTNRPEYENTSVHGGTINEVQVSLSRFDSIVQSPQFRRTVIILLLIVIWEVYARILNDELMLPSFTQSAAALYESTVHGPLLSRIGISLQVLLTGYGIGFFLAVTLTTFAVSSKWGADLLTTLTAMFNPLPAIALLPLALLWFGLGSPSLVFVIVHSVLWAVALNMHTGFQSVAEAQRMTGRNYGLSGVSFVARILIPAAFPSILAGLKIGWAFAWRTQVAAELVFGATSSSGGLGWFIFEGRNELDTARVFAGLISVVIIGLLVESVVFRTVEAITIRKWGMQR